MIIGIRVEALQPKTGKLTHTNSCYFTMAAKDDNGQLAEVPGLIISSSEELRRFCEGKELKDFSRKKRAMLRSDLSHLTLDDLYEIAKEEKCQLLIR